MDSVHYRDQVDQFNTLVEQLIEITTDQIEDHPRLRDNLVSVSQVISNAGPKDLPLILLALKSLLLRFSTSDWNRTQLTILSTLLPLLVAQGEGTEVISLLLTKLNTSSTSTTSWLRVMCSLSDIIFPLLDQLIAFWDKTREGLVHQDQLARKRALYLVKRAVDTVGEEDLQRVFLMNHTVQVQQPVAPLLTSLFLVLETLEEKQAHLVKQVLPRLEDLGPSLQVDWVLVCYTRLFKHPNTAMVRWGLESFLTRLQLPQSSLASPSLPNFLSCPLLDVLSETKLYGGDGEHGTLDIEQYFGQEEGVVCGQVVAKILSTYLSTLLTNLGREEAGLLIRRLILAISSQSWGPLPLFWVTEGMASVNTSNIPRCFTGEEVVAVRHLVDSQMVYQEPLLRGAAQANLLVLVTRLIDSEQTGLLELSSLLATMWARNVLIPGTDLWTKVARFVRDTFFAEQMDQVFSLTSQSLSDLRRQPDLSTSLTQAGVTKTVLVLVLFIFQEGMEAGDMSRVRQLVTQSVTSSKNRAYSKERVNLTPEQSSRVDMFSLLLLSKVGGQVTPRRSGKEFLHFSPSLSDPPPSLLRSLDLTQETIQDLVTTLTACLEECMASQDVEAVHRAEVYLELLPRLLSLHNVQEEGGGLLQLAHTAHRYVSHEGSTVVSRAVSMRVLVEFSRFPFSPGFKREMASIVERLQISTKLLPLMSETSREEDIQNRMQQKEWGRLTCCFIRDQLMLLSTREISNNPHIKDILLDNLEKGGREGLVPSIQLARQLHQPCEDFLQASFNAVFETRKCELFWPSLSSWLDLAFSTLLLPNISTSLVLSLLDQVVDEADSVSGIFSLFLLRLETFFTTHMARLDLITLLAPILSRALTFGPVYRKDQKMVTETNRVISSKGLRVPANMTEGSDHLLDQGVRLGALSLLLKIFRDCKEHQEVSRLVFHILSCLQEVNKSVTGSKTRHFENSIIHKVRQRIYQVYVILVPLLQPQEAEQVFLSLLSELEEHNQQTSVRQLTEWTVVLLLTTHPILLGPGLWEGLTRVSSTKVTAVPSFLVILTQYLVWDGSSPDPSHLDLAIREISPWCLAQNFGTRLVAQTCFRKLWNLASSDPAYTSLTNKYSVLQDCIGRSVHPSNSDKITEDFYLTEFNPRLNFNLRDVLHEFPRLTGSPADELVPLYLLSQVPGDLHIPLTCPTSSLQSCLVRRREGQGKEVKGETEGQNVQKKITPWTSMLADKDIGDGLSRVGHGAQESRRAHPDLMLVASLVDKVPNLGGLARTCEVLGVGAMVMASRAVVKDKDFSAVSVTAENWLPIHECPTNMLGEFLMDRKREGFTVVGVEQASESVMLQEFTFPSKVVLLLGREKEGVPVDLLNMVDVCVEIPQSGLVRSLNVHVTGALVLWEYVKQHKRQNIGEDSSISHS